MPSICDLLTQRALPPLLTDKDGLTIADIPHWRARREELLDLLGEHLFGRAPAAPERVTGELVGDVPNAFAGKAIHQKLSLSFDTPCGMFSFPIDFIAPRSARPAPLFVVIAFRPDVPDRYLPMEEIIDCGYAVATFCYNDVTTDDSVQNGLTKFYPKEVSEGWGKIGMWAFAASRVLDWALTRPEVDAARCAVVGHSRLGKTALWAGAQDERFSLVISNDSGCAGTALSRGKTGETIADITRVFPYWFSPAYACWAHRESEAPFDQHMLLALTAPRRLYAASAVEDAWADPLSEFLSCAAASPVYSLYGLDGLTAPDTPPESPCAFHGGFIGYHLRGGSHFLSRTDWLNFIRYRDRHNV